MILFSVMELLYRFQKLCQIETRRGLVLVGVVAVSHLLFQSLLLPYGNSITSLPPGGKVPGDDKYSFWTSRSYSKSLMIRNPRTINASDFTNTSVLVEGDNDEEDIRVGDMGHLNVLDEEDRDVDSGFTSENDVDRIERLVFDSVENQENTNVLESDSGGSHVIILENISKPDLDLSADNMQEEDATVVPKKIEDVYTAFQSPLSASQTSSLLKNITHLNDRESNARYSVGSAAFESDLVMPKNNSAMTSDTGKKKLRCEIPPKSITSLQEMNRLLKRHHSSPRAMRPQWASVRDQEILAAKFQIRQAPVAINDKQLYAPLFRNVSMFKRSYELMKRMLKVYIYKEGNKPIFHQPVLKGLYASEGWFMKLMERNIHFVVKDPRKAHLFYMPFSSRMLEYALYVRNSHDRTNLRRFLKDYTENIAQKYPYFNRTGGADHFLVACHDWAPYETRHHMERCIKALCNADFTTGFKIGRDVSLPETYVRSPRNPLKDLGGKPPSQRHILAFYAGNMHGYLRPILLKHWKGKDSDMKIYGPIPSDVASKMNYNWHMKSSKYCICPKGYDVNSPRVVEAIFYECVPVIISDNFVPPFFEVLDWGAFSIIIAEKEIPNLKDILLSIPEKRYLEMQLAVRKVQRHFLWHAKPMKYDLFHMTLHSIWYNRVHQIKLR
ncbi:Exostosin domain-containing protein [Cephalotus follicularis]|uniref:Exostosin domain-containing protein n=1 Tax=Cephalotus follicularis TaxID=3775 RepID=A0A1Q3D1P6_CEPFO|nr:Exostosin domain-containing protein [Cephalotus follicularis]